MLFLFFQSQADADGQEGRCPVPDEDAPAVSLWLVLRLSPANAQENKDRAMDNTVWTLPENQFSEARGYRSAIQTKLDSDLGVLDMFEIRPVRHRTGVWQYSAADHLVSLRSKARLAVDSTQQRPGCSTNKAPGKNHFDPTVEGGVSFLRWGRGGSAWVRRRQWLLDPESDSRLDADGPLKTQRIHQ